MFASVCITDSLSFVYVCYIFALQKEFQMSSSSIVIRVSDEEKEMILEAAKAQSLTVSSYVRSIVIGRIKAIKQPFSHVAGFTK